MFFDNLRVRHDRGRILEENHYYPFGLRIDGLSSRAYDGPANRYGYQGDYSEYDDDLGWNDFELRSYDPQLGRWLQVDPYDEFASGYVGMGNDPVNFIDEDGGTIGTARTFFDVAADGTVSMGIIAKKLSWFERTVRKVGKVAAKVADVAIDFVPLVGSARDIYRGVRDGDWAQIGMGVVGLAADVVTLGGSSLVKGGVKQGVKAALKTGTRSAVKNASEEGAEGLVKKTMRQSPCGCFVAGTLILTSIGPKPIEAIVVGDTVWAYNDTTGAYGQKRVKTLFHYERDSVYHVQIGDEVIKATADHPFFIGGRWLRVAELKVGDSVQLFDGSNLVIEQITVVPGRTTVYNFEVADYHTYYVAGAKVLVHNSSPCDVVLPRKQGSNATSGNNKFAQEGKQKHKELDDRVEQKEGWEHKRAETGFEGTDGNMYYPDVKTASGNYLELKPDTKRGRSRGKSQVKKYKSVHPDPNVKFRVIYYKPLR